MATHTQLTFGFTEDVDPHLQWLLDQHPEWETTQVEPAPSENTRWPIYFRGTREWGQDWPR